MMPPCSDALCDLATIGRMTADQFRFIIDVIPP